MEDVEDDLPEEEAKSQTDRVFLEQLQYLKEISDQQRALSRIEALVGRCCDGRQQCDRLADRCGTEIDSLQNERKRLMSRVRDIDSDVVKLSEISKALTHGSSVQCAAAPMVEYAHLLQKVNAQRLAGQLPPLTESSKYQQLRQAQSSAGPVKCRRKVSESEVTSPRGQSPCTLLKAGRSHKLCPACLKQVSRNAVACPCCKATCKKPVKSASTSGKCEHY